MGLLLAAAEVTARETTPAGQQINGPGQPEGGFTLHHSAVVLIHPILLYSSSTPPLLYSTLPLLLLYSSTPHHGPKEEGRAQAGGAP